MKFELQPYNRNASDEELLSDLKKVAQQLEKDSITRDEYNKYGRFSEGTLRKRFGGWLAALEKSGLRKTKFYWANEHLIAELKRIATISGKNSLTQKDFLKHRSISNFRTIVKRFGSWANALKQAGLGSSPMWHSAYAENDLLNNLLDVWVHYKRQPKSSEMDKPPSKICSDSYVRRFGSWRKALESFVARMNEDEQDAKKSLNSSLVDKNTNEELKKLDKNAEGIKQQDEKRNIGLGLRYKVFARDRFKCVKCGASPATKHDCRLHVDHKVPFSKGGKTTEDNLQTLCERCNLGKGDRHSE